MFTSEINVHECELHGILLYKWEFYCCLKRTKLHFLCQILVLFIFGMKSHHKFIKLPQINVYYIYFQTIENSWGQRLLLK